MTNFRWDSCDVGARFEALGTEFGDSSDLRVHGYHPRISVEYIEHGKYKRVEGDLIHYSTNNIRVDVEHKGVEVVDLGYVKDFSRIDSPELS